VRRIRVELLWWEGCPSTPDALTDLRQALADAGLDAPVEMIEIETDEQARRERFPGSPTIRIDGEDVVPCPQEEPHSLTCRVYRLRDGRPSPTPDPEDIREALKR
jgi:hypothetical protein